MERLEMERLGLGVIDKVVNTATNVYDYAAHGIPPDISTISNDIIVDVIEMQNTIKTDLSSRNYHILFAKFNELTKKFQRLHSALESKQSTLPPAPNSQPPQVHPQTPQQYAQHPTYASPQQPHPYDYPQPTYAHQSTYAHQPTYASQPPYAHPSTYPAHDPADRSPYNRYASWHSGNRSDPHWPDSHHQPTAPPKHPPQHKDVPPPKAQAAPAKPTAAPQRAVHQNQRQNWRGKK